MAVLLKCALCIPIYEPKAEFYNSLAKFESNDELEFVLNICETYSDGKTTVGQKDRFLSLKNFARVHYDTIPKSQFNHSRTRNGMLESVLDCDFVVFSTQDSFFSSEITAQLLIVLREMLDEDLSAVSFRHESPKNAMNAVFDEIFKNLSSEKYKNGLPSEIKWWSNNFSIYQTGDLAQIPFPEEVSWAEDLAWARMARMHNMKLRVEKRFAIQHLNDDSILSAYRRGISNAYGLEEIKSVFQDVPTIALWRRDLFKSLYGMFVLEIKRAYRERRIFSSIFTILHTLVIWSAQATGRIRTMKVIHRKRLAR